jgi:CheY-like chemotaxis protein
VEVWDTGIGIPEDKTAEIFEEFKQLHNDERNRGKGSGLGLAIVAKTAALLGLEVRVKSLLGRGSMFAVEFPLGQAAERESADHADYKSLWIGVVENDPAVLEALTRSLESIGHQVVDAATGEQLLELLDGIPPDIVVSDYRLADGESGFDVIKRVRDTFDRNVPALVITGDTDSQVMRHMATQGIRVLHKPVELETLQDCMAELTAAVN